MNVVPLVCQWSTGQNHIDPYVSNERKGEIDALQKVQEALVKKMNELNKKATALASSNGGRVKRQRLGGPASSSQDNTPMDTMPSNAAKGAGL